MIFLTSILTGAILWVYFCPRDVGRWLAQVEAGKADHTQEQS